MSARVLAQSLAHFLQNFSAGSAEASIDGLPFAELDADQRNLTVRIDPLRTEGRSMRSLLSESHLHLWETRGVPGSLARAGWRVSLHEGPSELVRLGRDVSPLTGHVHVSPSVLLRRRRTP